MLLFVLLLSAWLFIIDFSQYAGSIGEGVKDSALEEKTKFIGTWETTYIENDERFVGFNGIYQFNTDGTGLIGAQISAWEIDENRLIIKYYEGLSSKTYEYSFSDNDSILILIDSNGALVFTKNTI